ncbi:hypothetical protein NL108_001783 [Boleophthalmus pectinirostris]|nr:hypothetical protein NL108_001783 [Boleophthalmus pectinirostris]
MDLTHFWILGTMLVLIHQHQGESSSTPGPSTEEGPLTQLRHMAHRREKRCSCENQKDKECIFFCHIGIVWVNTPSQVVPYGFGSVRLRRELSRCLCKHKQDPECERFCSFRPTTEEDISLDKRTLSSQHKGRRSAFWEKRDRHALKPHT